MASHRRDHLALSPSLWREVLHSELVDSGFEHDIAGLIARRVIERVVHSYLTGDLPGDPPATHSLEEAA